MLLSLAGQVCALMLIDAGKLVHYQHYRPFEGHPAALCGIAIQAVLVSIALWRRWPALRRALPARGWRLAAVGVFFVLSSAAPSARAVSYGGEMLFASFVEAVQLGNAILIAGGLCAGEAAGRWLQSRRFVPLAAAWVLGVSAFLNVAVYERHPHVSDEVSYLLHARYVAAGRIDLPAPPVSRAFDMDLVTFDKDRFYVPSPPGWPLPLAAGVLLGVPWLVNPVLAALCVVLTSTLIEGLYGRPLARWTVFLLSVSPWFLFLAMSFMTHIFALLCALCASLAATRRRFFASGAALGVLSLVRPFEAVALGAVLALVALSGTGRMKAVLWLVVGAAVCGWPQLPYSRALTGSASKFPLMEYFDRTRGPGKNDLGFGANRGFNWPIDPFPGHGPLDVAANAALNITSLNTELLGWSTGSLLFLALFLVTGKLSRADQLMLAMIASAIIVHIFYWFSGGPDFGARYWLLMIVPLIALTARSLQRLASANGPGAYSLAAALATLALVTFIPWRAGDKYHLYLNMRPDVRELAATHHFGRSLVFIRGQRFPDYASAAVYNPLDLRADQPVYVWDRDPATHQAALDAYPDRPVWVLEGPGVTGGAFRIAGRPGN